MNVDSSSTYVNNASSNKGFSGMISGMDTEKLVEEMLQGTQAKIDKQNALKQQTIWKQEMYRDVISKINSFQDKYFGFTSESSFMTGEMFTAMGVKSTSTAFDVTASGLAQPGEMKVDVLQLASKASVSSNPVSGGLSMKLDGSKLTSADGSLELTVELNGVRKTVTAKASGSETLEEALQAALNKNFGTGAIQLKKDGADGAYRLLTSSKGQTLTVSGKALEEMGNNAFLSNKISRNSKLADLNFATPLQGNHFTFTINGTEITASADETLSSLMEKVNKSDAGVNLIYDDLSDTFRMEAKESGEGFSITMSQSEGNLLSGMFGLSAGSSATSKELTGAGIASTGKQLTGNWKEASFSITVNGTSHTFKLAKEAVKDADGKEKKDADGNVIYKEFTKEEVLTSINAQMDKAFGTGAIQLKEDGSVAVTKAGLHISVPAAPETPLTEEEIKKQQEAGNLNTILGLNNGQNNKVDGNTASSQVLELKDVADVGATVGETFDSVQDGRVTITKNPVTEAEKALFGNVVLGDGSGQAAHSTQGTNAVVRINGTLTERSSNQFETGGLTFSLKETTVTGVTISRDGNGQLVAEGLPENQNASQSITVEQNNDKIFDNIKSFVDDYNKLIEDLNKLVDAEASYKKHAPLTKAQKKEMTEHEIELWEEKSKEGLLRRDSTIGSFLENMRSVLYQKPDPDGLALYDIGIDTGDWKSKGKLVIKDEKALRSAIETKADQIQDLFMGEKGLANQMKDVLEDTAKTSSADPGVLVRIAGAKGTASDKENQMQRQLDGIADKLRMLEFQYKQEKNRYWKQFNAMERVLSDMSSQSAWLGQMMGG